MKYNKFLLLTCLSLLMVACNDNDEKINTISVTVQFEEVGLQVKESANVVQIPIVTTGETNGQIQIRVTMKENSSNFKLDEDIIITDEYITIPTGVETVNFETRLIVENTQIDPGRYITFEIVDVKGATKGTNSTCTLDIEENNILEGTYTFSGYNLSSNANTQMTVKIEAVEGSDDKLSVDFGTGGTAVMEYWESDEPGIYNVSMATLQKIGVSGSYDILLTWVQYDEETGTRYYSSTTPITGYFSEETMSITLETGMGYLAANADGSLAGWFNAWKQGTITLTK